MKKAAFFSIALITGVILGFFLALRMDIFSYAQGQSTLSSLKKQQNINIEEAVVNVAETTGKAVVSIGTERVTKIQRGRNFYFNQPFGNSPMGENEFLKRFFDDFFGGMPDQEFKQSGLGSGVIISPEGYILTNEHVINNADKIQVTLPDGREFKGEIRGKDSRSDLAIVKIDASDLPVAVLGDSDEIKIGQWVVAIGNPFGFALQNPEPTVTVGVVSALHRSLGRNIVQGKDYNDFIQTDAAINPGNSGGPLVNLEGQVIGINVAIFSTTGGYQGIGFAIPVNKAKRVISLLIEGKEVVYGWLGITVQSLTEDLSNYFGLSDINGVLVSRVLENSPAEKAGIKEGDVIKEFDGTPVNNVRELLSMVGMAEVGRSVEIAVWRNKKKVSLKVEIGVKPDDSETAVVSSPSQEEAAAVGEWRGIEAADLNDENIRRFEIEEKRGVVVLKVKLNSPAEEAGIIPGDTILEINNKRINNLNDFQRIIPGLKEDVLVKTSRGYFVLRESGKE